MSNTIFAVTIDCKDAPRMAQFWSAILGREVAEESTAEHMVLMARDDAASEPRIVFNKVPEPKIVKNRVHLDLISGTFDDEAERLLSLGAQRLHDFKGDDSWSTFADIEGNEFDLIDG
jgi:catechol 2,3-dioxygenase-like lactoylglutathione lyase family enzyme